MPKRTFRLHFRKLEDGKVTLQPKSTPEEPDDGIEVVTRAGKRKILEDDLPPIEEEDKLFDPRDESVQDFYTSVIGTEELPRKQRKMLKEMCHQALLTQPTAKELLTLPVFEKDRITLLKMLRALKQKEEGDEDYLGYERSYIQKKESFQRHFDEVLTLPPALQRSHTDEKDRIAKLSEKQSYSFQIINLNADDSVKRFIYQRYLHYERMSNTDDEKSKIEQWLNTVLALPFNVFVTLTDDRERCLRSFQEILNREIYGMVLVKEQLLVFLNARLTNQQLQGANLALLGPPGVGKTKIARLMAKALALPFAQISCGGMEQIERLKGHSYTYIGSQPGDIAYALLSMKANNGVMFFDEFEKVGSHQGKHTNNLYNTFLHILDPEQNSKFHDDYLGAEIPIDLSKMWFILAMNELPDHNALKDRLYVIELPAYSVREKIAIAQRHLIPGLCQELKLDGEKIIISDLILEKMIYHFQLDKVPGVRSLVHLLKEFITKIHFLQTSSIPTSFHLKGMRVPYVLKEEDFDLLHPTPRKEHLSIYV